MKKTKWSKDKSYRDRVQSLCVLTRIRSAHEYPESITTNSDKPHPPKRYGRVHKHRKFEGYGEEVRTKSSNSCSRSREASRSV